MIDPSSVRPGGRHACPSRSRPKVSAHDSSMFSTPGSSPAAPRTASERSMEGPVDRMATRREEGGDFSPGEPVQLGAGPALPSPRLGSDEPLPPEDRILLSE